jgi:hypothetical protein
MASSVDPKKIQNVISVPVVSTDSLSPEAKLMRSAKQMEAQAEIDTKYDPIVERFSTDSGQISRPLVGLTLFMGILAIHVLRLNGRF